MDDREIRISLLLSGCVHMMTNEGGMKELDEQNAKVLTVVVLRNFYQMPYQAEEEAQFYPEFEERLDRLNAMVGF